MKCSPFLRRFGRAGKHMHHGKFMKHFMRHSMDGYASSSCSSSDDECRRIETNESSNDMQSKMGHHDMKHKKHMRKHGHGKMHKMKHGQGMKHCHDKYGKKHDRFMDHRMKHRHGMKHKMHHGHGRKHKMGHGPGFHHKLRNELENTCSQNEETPIEVEIETMNENSERETFTLYKPKTSVQVMNENNKFQIYLDTSYYQPEEVSVKIVDGKIDVSAVHESIEDNIYEFHEMYRSFEIPSNVNPEEISARLNADGKLIIEAVCNNQEETIINEQDIPIIRESE